SPARPISARALESAALLAGFHRLAGIRVLSAGASARSPSGNSKRSRAGTRWAAAGAETSTEASAAKVKRDIYLRVADRARTVKQNPSRPGPAPPTFGRLE